MATNNRQPAAAADATISRARILLVEDELIIAMDEQRRLQQEGYEVEIVNSGEAAVAAVVSPHAGVQPVDLVLMDIDLGRGIDGIEAAEQILAEQTVPIVFLSSHQEPEIVERVRTVTRYGYVLKNSGTFILVEAIYVALEVFANQVVHSCE
ncbi:MAG: response regulator [Spirochaeta sp.]|jgi:CheY-like chemotaxis protein|nr:response regulator [Spirochaeta sp.]